MLVDETTILRWNPSNKKYYESLGYIFTKINEFFTVKVDDLTDKSHALVKVQCDCCGKIIEKPWNKYLSQHDNVLGDTCQNCKHVKVKHTLQEKYGVDAPIQNPEIKARIKATNVKKYGYENPMQNPDVVNKAHNTIREKYGCDNYSQTEEFIEKYKQTCRDKYGYEYSLQSPEIKAKSKQTNLEKYGCENPMQSDEVKAKVIATNLKKYGVKCSAQAESVKQKMRQTNKERYGVEYSCLADEVKKKAWDTLCKNGKIPVSKSEEITCQLLIDLYGEDFCVPSKSIGYYVLDCEVNINGTWIDVEYDGKYWHSSEQAIKRDKKRDEYLQQKHYKILRIKATKEIPTKEQLIEAIDYLVKGGHSYTEILLDI